MTKDLLFQVHTERKLGVNDDLNELDNLLNIGNSGINTSIWYKHDSDKKFQNADFWILF